MSEIARRSVLDLKRLNPALKPEVRDWLCAVRPIWAAAGVSMTEFTADAPIDKSTVSRILSGERVPRDRYFLDRLLDTVARNGMPVTPEVRKHLTQLQLRALEAAHPLAHKVRLLRDELETAVTSRRYAERYANGLEEILAEREREIAELTEDNNRLRATLDSEYERLTRELDFARQREAAAERRCRVLGSMLDLMDQTHPDQMDQTRPDQLQEVDAPHSIDWDGDVSHLPLDDLKAVALFLSVLLQLKKRDQAAVLADKVVSQITGRPYTPNDIAKRDGLLRLLATMNAPGLHDQADKLSNWMGYPPMSRYRPRLHLPSPPPS